MSAPRDTEGRRLGVAVAIARSDGRWLMVQRGPGRYAAGYWTPVTGAVEPGESPAQAAVREVAEEVGLAVDVPTEPFTSHPTDTGEWTIQWFAGRLRDGEDPDAWERETRELAAVRWCTHSELDRLEPMFEATRRALALAGERS